MEQGRVRADRRRNHDQLVAAANVVVARDGAQASLEEIARRAGVGSATLHRHFPSRRALLEAVFHDGIERLCQRADELLAGDDHPQWALETWLIELTGYTTMTRGVATTLLAGPDGGIAERDTCRGMLGDAATRLVEHASGTLRPGVAAVDLVLLTNAISLAGEGDLVGTRRLLDLALGGIWADRSPLG